MNLRGVELFVSRDTGGDFRFYFFFFGDFDFTFISSVCTVIRAHTRMYTYIYIYHTVSRRRVGNKYNKTGCANKVKTKWTLDGGLNNI